MKVMRIGAPGFGKAAFLHHLLKVLNEVAGGADALRLSAALSDFPPQRWRGFESTTSLSVQAGKTPRAASEHL